MTRVAPIRTPLRQRLRLFRQGPLPVLVWLGAIALVAVLASRRMVRVDAVGIAEVRHAVVTSLADGCLKFLNHDLYEPVRAGAVVAGLDEAPILAELETIRAEIARLRAELRAEEERLRVAAEEAAAARGTQARRFAWDLENAELDLLDRRLTDEVDRVERERLTLLLERYSQLVETGGVSAAEVDEVRLQREAVVKRIEHNVQNLAAARARRDAAAARARMAPVAAAEPAVDTLLEPLRRATAVQEAEIERLGLTRQALLLRAPLDGVVSQVLHRSGEAVVAGDPILLIADPRTTRVVAHIPERTRHLDIRPGDTVELVRRRTPVEVLEAKVIRVGPAVEEIPIQERRNPTLVEWGRPVLIAASELELCPGETVDVRIPKRSGGP
ncbi:MAG: HlyD family efflux transporter periplasmic adaptor subunit [Planctomycetes bacterium]|nr:HlyD family efflux transporter periplasmic adaptor subunit [Planctomycetota bacterium]